MFKKWRLTDRTRTLLTLELAIVLPAAALMGFSIWNLKHLQHSGGFEAAIQRDLSHVLKIAEKKTLHNGQSTYYASSYRFPKPNQDRAAIKANWTMCWPNIPSLPTRYFTTRRTTCF